MKHTNALRVMPWAMLIMHELNLDVTSHLCTSVLIHIPAYQFKLE